MPSSEIPSPPISKNAVKVIWAKNEDMYGEIFSRGDGTYTFWVTKLFYEKMYHGGYEYYWHLVNHQKSIFDTIERGEELLAGVFKNIAAEI